MINTAVAPEIQRQRLLIEGFYQRDWVDENTITHYFQHITQTLQLRTYGEPIIFCPESLGKEENQGFDAFVPLIDSGISLYVWTQKQFVSLIIYTCKEFNETEALKATCDFFKITEPYTHAF